MPLISVIIPTYNGENYLAQTIQSVFSQTMQDWELIIVDDGSTDGTGTLAREMAASAPRIRLVHQANAGIADARNRGLRESTSASHYVIFLDHDDLWEPDALETLLRSARAYPQAPGVYGLLRYIDARGQPMAIDNEGYFPMGKKEVRKTRLTFGDCIRIPVFTTPGRLLVPRWAIEAAGTFDPAMAPADDWDIWLRLSLQGSLVCSSKLVLGWRLHGANASAQTRRMYHAIMRVYHKSHTAQGLTLEQRQAARQGFRWYHWCNFQLRWQWATASLRRRALWTAGKQARHACVHIRHALLGDVGSS